MKFNIDAYGKRYGVNVVEKVRKHSQIFFDIEFKRTKGSVKKVSECGSLPRDLETFLHSYPEIAHTFTIGESVFMQWGTGFGEDEKLILSQIPGVDWKTRVV